MKQKILVVLGLVLVFFVVVFVIGGRDLEQQRQAKYAAKAKQSQDTFKDRWNFPKNNHKQ